MAVVCEKYEFTEKKTKYCFCVVILNEGQRIRNQLARMKNNAHLADIVIADGRSTDGSTNHDFLKENLVRTLLITDEKGLSTATRMAVEYAMEQGYEGIITVDGNGKDGIEALPEFIKGLDDGYDLVQGSRFMKGGVHKNTPLERHLAVKFIAPAILFLGCYYWYSDPTNAFRAISMKFLKDQRVQPLREIFIKFNLQLYFIYRAAKLGFKVKQIPVVRSYPDDGSIPTKIVSWKLKYLNLKEMIFTAIGKYNP